MTISAWLARSKPLESHADRMQDITKASKPVVVCIIIMYDEHVYFFVFWSPGFDDPAIQEAKFSAISMFCKFVAWLAIPFWFFCMSSSSALTSGSTTTVSNRQVEDGNRTIIHQVGHPNNHRQTEYCY